MAATDAPIFGLRIFGDSLEPAEITALLGREPTRSFSKGDRNVGANGKEYAPRRTGMWLLEASKGPQGVEGCILGLLAELPQDLSVWAALSTRFELILSVGLFMDETNEEFALPCAVLEALGRRGISINFDIYAPIRSPEPNKPCPCGSGKLYVDCCAR